MNIASKSLLHGTHVVVFGGSSGIGLAAAAAAKASGADITLVGRSQTKLETAAQSIGGARTAVADIASREAVEAVFRPMTRVDHLVITAGSFTAGKLADTDPDQLLDAMRERIAGPVYAIRAALPLMPPTASIVLTGGQLSDRPSGHGTSVIAAAVRGVEALARSLALELKPIRVNVISPGFVDTPLFDTFGPENRAAVLAQAAAALPGGRIGRAEELGEAIAFLLGNRYINAEILHIDGGGRFV
ncbi:SDR family oxidoreductase [uncultured Ralstonia sp.]|jgi:NAD(P)-dependent dehydrogenase (short-subunit alcohol dehydrogenase family)|uniref:SDR family oxidoreductase n=1 Tax=uncultured Ralstonia sp. TaxID=114715 RepID=UPI0025FCBA37|nr:SDR family oxidoreductase [uncultured Ralstonia sp.]